MSVCGGSSDPTDPWLTGLYPNEVMQVLVNNVSVVFIVPLPVVGLISDSLILSEGSVWS